MLDFSAQTRTGISKLISHCASSFRLMLEKNRRQNKDKICSIPWSTGPTLVDQGVSVRLNGNIMEALLPPGGVERVSKIAMCISKKTLLLSAKTADLLGYAVHI